jgi:hypothetical protein
MGQFKVDSYSANGGIRMIVLAPGECSSPAVHFPLVKNTSGKRNPFPKLSDFILTSNAPNVIMDLAENKKAQ